MTTGFGIMVVLLGCCATEMVCAQDVTFSSPLPCKWTEVPSELIPNDTRVLTIAMCGELTVRPGDFAHLLQVYRITMYGCGLKELPDFRALNESLREIHAYGNNITYVNPHYLQDMGKLQILNLGTNHFLTHVPDVPELSSLRTLTLKTTGFQRLPQLRMNSNLLTLNINRMQNLKYIHRADLTLYPVVRLINLNDNQLETLPDFGIVNGTLRTLRMARGIMSSAPATHMIGLRSLVTLDVSGAPHLEVVPSLCHENVAGLSMRVGGSALRLCDCRNAWLKQAAEAGANIEAANATCGGLSWHNLTTQQLLQVCTDGSYEGGMRQAFWESVPVDRPCAFPLHSILYDTPLSLCVNTCFDKIPGCLSFNFRPKLEERTRGDCVFVAPTAASPMQAPESALADTEGWMYVGSR